MGGAKLPGVILILAAVVLLALVSFSSPLLKNFYFLEGRYDKGDNDFTIRLGTLGYCLQQGGKETCVGPKIGYSFDLNQILGISIFKIPESVSKYLTYVLVLHIVALVVSAIAFILGCFELIPSVTLMCFPTCMTSISGVIALIAFIFDLAIFYIAKAAIEKVASAQASIGPAVWMTLAAWALLMIAICALGMASCCCCGNNDRRDKDRRKKRRGDTFDDDPYASRRDREDNSMRMQAIRDEERRKAEQDLPNFAPYEREPLNPYPHEDKYLYDDGTPTQYVGGLNYGGGGQGVHGVGVGYGRRNGAPNPYAAADPFAAGAAGAAGAGLGAGLNERRPSAGASSMLTAGNAGVGAGGDGIDRPGEHDYTTYNNMYNDGQEQFNDNNYYDPYAANNQYSAAGYGGNPTYPPVAAAAAVTSPQGYGHQQRGGPHDYFSGGPGSADSHQYADPGPRVHHAEDDGGLGAIGRAATSPTGERQYTGAQGFGSAALPATSPLHVQIPPPAPVQIPTPQRLVNAHGHHSTLLTSPDSEYPSEPRQSAFTFASGGASGAGGEDAVPPSYGQATLDSPAAAASSSYPNEKAQQRYVVQS